MAHEIEDLERSGSDVRVIEAPEVGVIVYRAMARREQENEYRALTSSAYVRRDERWRRLLHQQSPDPDH